MQRARAALVPQRARTALVSRRARTALACVLLAALVSSCGSSRVVPPLPDLPSRAMRGSMWDYKLSGGDIPLALVPAVVDGTVYAASRSGDVVKLDARTGERLWRVDLDVGITGAVGASASLLAVGTATGEVIALDTDGKQRWRVRVTSEVTAPPLVYDDLVVVRTADANVFALDIATGQRRWLFQRSPPALVVRGYTAFAAEGPIVYAGLEGGKLAAISTVNGGPRWESTVSVPRGTTEIERITDVVGEPWSSSTEVCAASYQGRVACFEASSGNTLWTKELSTASGLTGDARYLFVSDEKGAVVALDRSNGAVVWRDEKLVGRDLSQPLAHGNEVIVGDMEGFVHFLDRTTGNIIGRGRTNGDPIDVPPVQIPGGILVQTRSGALVAFGPGI
jgi:outer membrane protein assembly factor BamB